MTTPAIDTIDVDFPRPDRDLVERLAKLPAANIGDAMDRLGVAHSAIQAIDGLVDRLDRQVVKHKEKLQGHQQEALKHISSSIGAEE